MKKAKTLLTIILITAFITENAVAEYPSALRPLSFINSHQFEKNNYTRFAIDAYGREAGLEEYVIENMLKEVDKGKCLRCTIRGIPIYIVDKDAIIKEPYYIADLNYSFITPYGFIFALQDKQGNIYITHKLAQYLEITESSYDEKQLNKIASGELTAHPLQRFIVAVECAHYFHPSPEICDLYLFALSVKSADTVDEADFAHTSKIFVEIFKELHPKFESIKQDLFKAVRAISERRYEEALLIDKKITKYLQKIEKNFPSRRLRDASGEAGEILRFMDPGSLYMIAIKILLSRKMTTRVDFEDIDLLDTSLFSDLQYEDTLYYKGKMSPVETRAMQLLRSVIDKQAARKDAFAYLKTQIDNGTNIVILSFPFWRWATLYEKDKYAFQYLTETIGSLYGKELLSGIFIETKSDDERSKKAFAALSKGMESMRAKKIPVKKYEWRIRSSKLDYKKMAKAIKDFRKECGNGCILVLTGHNKSSKDDNSIILSEELARQGRESKAISAKVHTMIFHNQPSRERHLPDPGERLPLTLALSGTAMRLKLEKLFVLESTGHVGGSLYNIEKKLRFKDVSDSILVIMPPHDFGGGDDRDEEKPRPYQPPVKELDLVGAPIKNSPTGTVDFAEIPPEANPYIEEIENPHVRDYFVKLLKEIINADNRFRVIGNHYPAECLSTAQIVPIGLLAGQAVRTAIPYYDDPNVLELKRKIEMGDFSGPGMGKYPIIREVRQGGRIFTQRTYRGYYRVSALRVLGVKFIPVQVIYGNPMDFIKEYQNRDTPKGHPILLLDNFELLERLDYRRKSYFNSRQTKNAAEMCDVIGSINESMGLLDYAAASFSLASRDWELGNEWRKSAISSQKVGELNEEIAKKNTGEARIKAIKFAIVGYSRAGRKWATVKEFLEGAECNAKCAQLDKELNEDRRWITKDLVLAAFDYFRGGKIEKAKEYYMEATKLNPDACDFFFKKYSDEIGITLPLAGWSISAPDKKSDMLIEKNLAGLIAAAA